MKFLVDAQLPLRLAQFLTRAGHDAAHTTELPDGNRSTDRQVSKHADREGRAVITKDRGFRDGHLLTHSPQRLLVVSTGNITNDALLELFETHLVAIVTAFDEAHFVELSRDTLALRRLDKNADE